MDVIKYTSTAHKIEINWKKERIDVRHAFNEDENFQSPTPQEFVFSMTRLMSGQQMPQSQLPCFTKSKWLIFTQTAGDQWMGAGRLQVQEC